MLEKLHWTSHRISPKAQSFIKCGKSWIKLKLGLTEKVKLASKACSKIYETSRSRLKKYSLITVTKNSTSHLTYFFLQFTRLFTHCFSKGQKEGIHKFSEHNKPLLSLQSPFKPSRICGWPENLPSRNRWLLSTRCNGNIHCTANVGLLFGLQRLIRSSLVGKGTFFNAIPLLSC